MGEVCTAEVAQTRPGSPSSALSTARNVRLRRHVARSGVLTRAADYYSGLWPCGDGYFSCDYGECSSSFTVPGGRLQVNTELINLLGLDSPTATVTSPAETIMATTTETAVASDGAAPAAQGVSTGAAAGIGVGVGIPLLIAAVVFGALFVMERRKRRSLEQTAPSSYSGHTSYDPYQKGGQVYHGASPGAQSNELDTLSSPHELDSERGAA